MTDYINNKLQFVTSGGHQHKVLPDGVHHFSEDELCKVFCSNFSSSETRNRIINGYQSFKNIISATISSCHWVDGSFVEDKLNPNDIDVVVWVDAEQLNALPQDVQCQLHKLFGEDKKNTKKLYLTDSYLNFVCDPSNPGYRFYKECWHYWRKWLGNTRTDNPKGIVRLMVEKPGCLVPNVPSEW